MKIKLNWGFGIALTYIVFVFLTLVMVVIFMRQDVTLENKDYYARGLVYQDKIEKITNSKNLPEQLDISVASDFIKLAFPKMFGRNDVSGSITFYRPASDKEDFTVNISPDTSNTQIIPTKDIARGLWKVRVDWSAKGINYFDEKPIMVN